MNKKFEVHLYHTAFTASVVNAKSEEEAILKARKRKINLKEISSNLESWKDADTAEEIVDGKSTNKNTL